MSKNQMSVLKTTWEFLQTPLICLISNEILEYFEITSIRYENPIE